MFDKNPRPKTGDTGSQQLRSRNWRHQRHQVEAAYKFLMVRGEQPALMQMDEQECDSRTAFL